MRLLLAKAFKFVAYVSAYVHVRNRCFDEGRVEQRFIYAQIRLLLDCYMMLRKESMLIGIEQVLGVEEVSELYQRISPQYLVSMYRLDTGHSKQEAQVRTSVETQVLRDEAQSLESSLFKSVNSFPFLFQIK